MGRVSGPKTDVLGTFFLKEPLLARMYQENLEATRHSFPQARGNYLEHLKEDIIKTLEVLAM